MRFDVIRAVEACYAQLVDDRAWLDGVSEALEPLDQGPGFAGILVEGSRKCVLSATSAGRHPNELVEIDSEDSRFRVSFPPDAFLPACSPARRKVATC
jgi:hypothetical protein